MKYLLKDLQFENRYFGGDEPVIFHSKKEICEQLIEYHNVDCDMKEEEKLLKEGKIDECLELLKDFE